MHICTFGFGFGFRPKARCFSGQIFGFGLKWKTYFRSFTGRQPYSSNIDETFFNKVDMVGSLRIPFFFVMKLSKVGFSFPEPFAGLLCFSLPLLRSLDSSRTEMHERLKGFSDFWLRNPTLFNFITKRKGILKDPQRIKSVEKSQHYVPQSVLIRNGSGNRNPTLFFKYWWDFFQQIWYSVDLSGSLSFLLWNWARLASYFQSLLPVFSAFRCHCWGP